MNHEMNGERLVQILKIFEEKYIKLRDDLIEQKISSTILSEEIQNIYLSCFNDMAQTIFDLLKTLNPKDHNPDDFHIYFWPCYETLLDLEQKHDKGITNLIKIKRHKLTGDDFMEIPCGFCPSLPEMGDNMMSLSVVAHAFGDFLTSIDYSKPSNNAIIPVKTEKSLIYIEINSSFQRNHYETEEILNIDLDIKDWRNWEKKLENLDTNPVPSRKQLLAFWLLAISGIISEIRNEINEPLKSNPDDNLKQILDSTKEYYQDSKKYPNFRLIYFFQFPHDIIPHFPRLEKSNLGSVMLLSTEPIPSWMLFLIRLWIMDIFKVLRQFEICTISEAEKELAEASLNRSFMHSAKRLYRVIADAVEQGNNSEIHQERVKIISYSTSTLFEMRQYFNFKENRDPNIEFDFCDFFESLFIYNLVIYYTMIEYQFEDKLFYHTIFNKVKNFTNNLFISKSNQFANEQIIDIFLCESERNKFFKSLNINFYWPDDCKIMLKTSNDVHYFYPVYYVLNEFIINMLVHDIMLLLINKERVDIYINRYQIRNIEKNLLKKYLLVTVGDKPPTANLAVISAFEEIEKWLNLKMKSSHFGLKMIRKFLASQNCNYRVKEEGSQFLRLIEVFENATLFAFKPFDKVEK